MYWNAGNYEMTKFAKYNGISTKHEKVQKT